MIPLAVVFACWLLLGAVTWIVAIAAADPGQREDDEVAALDALWDLPARSPSRWWPPC